jgi:hypothetical protein
VSYRMLKKFVLVPQKSADVHATLTVPNIPLFSAAARKRCYKRPFRQKTFRSNFHPQFWDKFLPNAKYIIFLPIILFLSTTLLTGMTDISLQMQ